MPGGWQSRQPPPHQPVLTEVAHMVSVIIPTRSEPYLQKTVDDVLAKATGEIEVIVVMDGGEDALVTSDPRVSIINHHTPRGTRRSLNEAVAAARGDHIL